MLRYILYKILFKEYNKTFNYLSIILAYVLIKSFN